jgi:two-component system nitrate/nitrite response regulator NarL
MASLAVIHPSPLSCAGLAALVSTMGFEPVAQAASLDELIQAEEGQGRPELLLVGAPQQVPDIASFMREVRAWAPAARTVFIAPSLDVPTLMASFAANAFGYLTETVSREGLQHSLRLVNAGEKVFPSELANLLSTSGVALAAPDDVQRELRQLHMTTREVEVLRRLAHGLSNPLIAVQLDISETAVSTAIRHILRKLGVSNRTQAALWAVAKGVAAPLGGGHESEDR